MHIPEWGMHIWATNGWLHTSNSSWLHQHLLDSKAAPPPPRQNPRTAPEYVSTKYFHHCNLLPPVEQRMPQLSRFQLQCCHGNSFNMKLKVTRNSNSHRPFPLTFMACDVHQRLHFTTFSKTPYFLKLLFFLFPYCSALREIISDLVCLYFPSQLSVKDPETL